LSKKGVALSKNFVDVVNHAGRLWIQQREGVVEDLAASTRAPLDDRQIIRAKCRDRHNLGEFLSGLYALSVDLGSPTTFSSDFGFNENLSIVDHELGSKNRRCCTVSNHRLFWASSKRATKA
jgi:hypothetical protein